MHSQHGPQPRVPAPPQPPEPPSTQPSGGDSVIAGSGPGWGGAGAKAGTILILIGFVLLAVQLVPGLQLWTLWPLFIIVPGLVECFSPGPEGWGVRRLLEGLTTVSVGLVFLGNMTGYLAWDVWWRILQLWPVLLISAGLGILGKSMRQEWIRVLGTLAVLGALGLAVASNQAGVPMRFVQIAEGEPFAFSEPIGPAREARLKVEAGAGDVRIASGTELVAIEGASPFSAPEFSANRRGSGAEVEFNLTGDEQSFVYPVGGAARADIRISGDVVWDIEVDSGASSLLAELADVQVRSLRLKTGVSSNQVVLGEVPDGIEEATVSIDTGVSSVKLLVPDRSMVRVESRGGLTGHSVGRGFEEVDPGIWQTPGYDRAVNARSGVWTIILKSGVGSVAVDTY